MTKNLVSHMAASLMFLALASPASASGVATKGAVVGQWTMDYTAAKTLAAKKSLPILINFTGSDWCGWCKLMDKNVFSDKKWKGYAAKNLVLATIDFPKVKSLVPEEYKARNDGLKSTFKIKGYPTYVLLDSDAKTELGRLAAGRDKTAASFQAEVEALLAMRASAIEAFVKRVDEMTGKRYVKAIADLKKARSDLAAWINTKPKRNEENTRKYADLQSRIKAPQDLLVELRGQHPADK